MNTNILNKIVAAVAAVALCLALAIIVSPLAHAEDDSTFTQSTEQNDPVSQPDGSQGGGYHR